ncbi:MAG: integrase arm-type DNA-binding domain-containing protein [Sterolibacterium sp.]|jgi:integrase|nr:integrase arm-type DNA-binding domain-containing protein [Sterolibacterium sp.]
MARLVDKLTPLAVSKATKPGYYGDGGGLWLQVSPSGSKSWIFRFTLSKKQREMGLGAVHTVTLPEARARAKECRLILLEGKDPLEIRKASKLVEALERSKMMTFDQCAAAYIAAHRGGWKNAKHASQWENTLETYASPIIGKMPVALVDTALVVKVLSPIWQTKTETATRLRGRIESILDWATVSEYRQGDNPARWRGHLDNLLADPSRSKRTVHHPALSWQEVGAFMANLRGQDGIAAKAVELAILTACRSGEVRLATWAEFDLDAALWVIPAERMKAKREHRVPLSVAALALLESMPRMGNQVFPGAKPGKALSDMSLTAVLRRMKRDDITVHGFRSSFRDWCAESVANSFPREVCEHALAHSLPDKVEAAYRRGDLIEKRTMLMQAWADYCGTVPTVANATPIRKVA